MYCLCILCFFFKQKTAYEMRISDWSSDVCSSDLKEDLKMTLGEVLEQAGKKQIRIAETEKYPHVTFIFSGGREKEFRGEKRLMIPSPKEIGRASCRERVCTYV